MQIKFDLKYIIILIIAQCSPIVAGIVHYQFATIHPYLPAYYVAMSIGPFHNYEALLRTLDPKKRKALELFRSFATVTAAQIGQLFGFKPRTSAQLCKNWVEEGFLVIANPANKNRSYRLSSFYEALVQGAKIDNLQLYFEGLILMNVKISLCRKKPSLNGESEEIIDLST
jgi:hypothetical protein